MESSLKALKGRRSASNKHRAHKLSDPPRAAIITMAGHPLRGRALQVDSRVASRSDGFVQVVLPDGSRTVVPLEWTDLVVGETTADVRGVWFTRDGIRTLLRLVDAMLGRS